MLPKKFEIATVAMAGRRYSWLSTHRMPSTISATSRLSLGGGSTRSPRRMRTSSTAEARKLIASARMATGAVTRPMSAPATPGPTRPAAEREISSFEFPSLSWLRSTSEGRYDW
jgi:hypothetical protein